MSSTTDPAELILADAADLIEARGWDRTAQPYAPSHTTQPYAPDYTGALSVRGALEIATGAREWQPYGHAEAGTPLHVTSSDAEDALAEYVLDTVFIPMHSDRVFACPACTQCREHQNLPLTLARVQVCQNGCALCDDHAHLSDPHGFDKPPAEVIIEAWEGYMPHQRDVISGLRAAASRPTL